MTADIDEIGRLLSKIERRQPCFDLDKQIIAAAHRELEENVASNRFQLSWWRKISLPLYVVVGFTLTILAYDSLWPTLPYLNAESANSTAEMEILIEQTKIDNDANYKDNLANSSSSRERILLPKRLDVPNLPDETREESKIVGASPINVDVDDANSSPGKNQDYFFTGNQLIKSEFPEKESWARLIIDYMRDGQFEQARTELRKFKGVYPNYPIEEQIKTFSH